MPKETDEQRRSRKAKEARERRRKRGLKPKGGAGKGQGRKMVDDPDRPSCCGSLMLSWGDRWRCKECKKLIAK